MRIMEGALLGLLALARGPGQESHELRYPLEARKLHADVELVAHQRSVRGGVRYDLAGSFVIDFDLVPHEISYLQVGYRISQIEGIRGFWWDSSGRVSDHRLHGSPDLLQDARIVTTTGQVDRTLTPESLPDDPKLASFSLLLLRGLASLPELPRPALVEDEPVVAIGLSKEECPEKERVLVETRTRYTLRRVEKVKGHTVLHVALAWEGTGMLDKPDSWATFDHGGRGLLVFDETEGVPLRLEMDSVTLPCPGWREERVTWRATYTPGGPS